MKKKPPQSTDDPTRFATDGRDLPAVTMAELSSIVSGSPPEKDERRETPATAREVAEWMVQQLRANGGILYQSAIVHRVETIFGSEHVSHRSDNGKPGIALAVLDEFKALTPDVGWDPHRQFWRNKTEADGPGRELR